MSKCACSDALWLHVRRCRPSFYHRIFCQIYLGAVCPGIGALSAGASSRLLIDYPELQRSQILDYLFLPKYGASIQYLKVEIGGNINSTCGVERNHMDQRGEENYQRSYEWRLMKEAKLRNPNIILDCLAWGTLSWIGNGNYFSQDMADYIVKFFKGAKTHHNLDISHTGIWNEKPYEIKWPIVDEMNADPALKVAIDVVGVHYVAGQSTPAARSIGKPLWASEDGPWSGAWSNDRNKAMLQRILNRGHINGQMTKTLIWSPISAYYDNLLLSSSGLMRANTPRSGHYQTQSGLWVTAHTSNLPILAGSISI